MKKDLEAVPDCLEVGAELQFEVVGQFNFSKHVKRCIGTFPPGCARNRIESMEEKNIDGTRPSSLTCDGRL